MNKDDVTRVAWLAANIGAELRGHLDSLEGGSLAHQLVLAVSIFGDSVAASLDTYIEGWLEEDSDDS